MWGKRIGGILVLARHGQRASGSGVLKTAEVSPTIGGQLLCSLLYLHVRLLVTLSKKLYPNFRVKLLFFINFSYIYSNHCTYIYVYNYHYIVIIVELI